MIALARSATAVMVGAASFLAWPLVTPAQAAPLAVCQWEDGQQSSTYSCTDFVDTVTKAEIVECWKYPVSPRTYLRQKTEAGWVRNAEITLRVRPAKSCEETHPYRTVISVAPTLLTEMQTLRIRMVMPASSGYLDDSTAYSYGKTVVTYGMCLMPEGSLEDCPER